MEWRWTFLEGNDEGYYPEAKTDIPTLPQQEAKAAGTNCALFHFLCRQMNEDDLEDRLLTSPNLHDALLFAA